MWDSVWRWLKSRTKGTVRLRAGASRALVHAKGDHHPAGAKAGHVRADPVDARVVRAVGVRVAAAGRAVRDEVGLPAA